MLIHDYLKTLGEIPGWFFPEDVHLFVKLDQLQSECRLSGDLLEIGVYKGKSAILLGYFLRERERLVVCDLFGADAETDLEQRENRTYYKSFNRNHFEQNYRRFHKDLPVIFNCSSTELGSRGLSKTFRFIHIDGSHQYDVVRQDIAIAKTLLVDGGIVSFDDYRALHTPGVAAAVWQELDSGVLRPLCTTASKLYAINGPDRFGLVSRIESWAALHADLHAKPELVAEQGFLCITLSPRPAPLWKRIYWEIIANRKRNL